MPSNSFNQDPGTNDELAAKYRARGVEFLLTETTPVIGANAHALFRFLTTSDNGQGFLTNDVKWNFTTVHGQRAAPR